MILIRSNAAALAKEFDVKAREFKAILLQSAEKARPAALRAYKRTTSTWRTKPLFIAGTQVRGNTVDLHVGTDDPVWDWVNAGTRAHAIFPVKAKVLAFRSTYAAKTTVGMIDAHSGGASGPMVFRRGVWHPGTTARKFTSMLKKELRGVVYEIIKAHVYAWWGKVHATGMSMTEGD